MKRKLLSFVLAVVMILSVLAILGSCDDKSANDTATSAPDTAVGAQKLTAPVVTLTGNVATWTAAPNADKFEISISGELSYVENTVTEKTLSNGQSFKVRAVGDGVKYATSEWSNAVMYTDGSSVVTPTKLNTPTVSVSLSGLASWNTVNGATGYSYRIDGGTEVVINETTVQLTVGQSLSVKAVGDGINYTDSEYSPTVTYTQGIVNPPSPDGAPAYLGIIASKNEPTSADGLPEILNSDTRMYGMDGTAGMYRSFEYIAADYYAKPENYLDTNYPTESDFSVYSRAGDKVYIQIWLNNPSQHTILSLKLNGTKYQVGGGLSSFFKNEGGVHYNCVYVAVTIPDGAHTSIDYVVSDIEYIADTYINADGTDEFMNDNDTVSIGLPYSGSKPTVSGNAQPSVGMNNLSASFNLSDESGIVNKTNGWLGVAVHNGSKIVYNKKIDIGSNTVNVSGLVENTRYWFVVYLYADLHDGNGVKAHTLLEQGVWTSEAITVNEVDGILLYDSVKDGYYGAIKVNTTLNSNTAEYIKLEILKDGEVVYTDTNFNGTATVSEGILCRNSYTVRVYYKDTEYTQGKYVEERAWVDSLGTPWYYDAGVYTFVNDAVYYFNLGNGDENYPAIENLVLKFYSDESPRWYASDILYIIDHPTAIEELEAQIDILRGEFNAAYGNSDLMNQIHAEISALEDQLRPLEDALWYLENDADNNRDRSYWEAEAAKGKYYYEFEYGVDNDKVFKVGQIFYVVLDDALTLGYDRLKVEIDYKYDERTGEELTEKKTTATVSLDRDLTNHWVLIENVSYTDGELTLSLYNEPDWWDGIRPPYAVGYVYKVEVDGKVLYIDESKHEFDIDETAWFNEYIQLIKAGQSVDGLIEKYVSDYESSYTIPVDASKIEAGYRNFGVSIRLINTDYEDGECQATRWADRVIVYAQIEKPSIEYQEMWGECYGVVTPGYIQNWYNDHYEYEAFDKNGNPVEITIASESGYARFYAPTVGTKVRVKIPASEYWLESEWSEWYTFEGIKLPAPEFGEYDLSRCKIGWSFPHDSTYVSHYVYTINGGTPITAGLEDGVTVFLKNGDVLRVKCVPNAEGIAKCFTDGEWAEYTCADNRTVLSTPTNLRIADKVLWWDAVDGAMYYVVEITYEGETTERIVRSNYMAPPMPGRTYRIRALAEDQENYRSSDWSEYVTYVG